jgi:hypothetical protein
VELRLALLSLTAQRIPHNRSPYKPPTTPVTFSHILKIILPVFLILHTSLLETLLREQAMLTTRDGQVHPSQ